jgi:hypothetical protein
VAVGVNIVSEFDSKGIKRAIADFKKLEGAGAKATYGLRTFDSALTAGVSKVARYGGIAAAALGGVSAYLIKGAEYAKQADDRLVAVAQSMGIFGASAESVATRLQKLADAQEYELGVTAETIKATQAKLLTFKNIAREADIVGGAFDRATTAAVDLAAAGFGAAEQNAVQLGKALQDPIKGITALARSGVTFTDAEKAKIKALVQSNQMLAAQDTLLKAIESQVGGTAASTVTDTFKIAAAFGHVRDEIGTLLLPIVEKFANFMVNKVVPYATEAGRQFGEKGFGGGVKFLVEGIDNFIQKGNKAVDIFIGLTAAMVALRGITMAAAAAQTLFNVALFANPIGIVVAAVIAVGVALAALYIRFEGLRKIINTMVNFALAGLEMLVNAVIGVINSFIRWGNVFNGVFRAIGINVGNIAPIAEVSFGRIGDAAQKTNRSLGETLSIIQQIKNAERRSISSGQFASGGGDDEETTFGGAGKAVKTAKERIKEYTDALKGQRSAERSVRDAMEGTTKARLNLKQATDSVASAQENFNRVTRGYARDSKEALDAMRDVTSAQKRLRDANISLDDAVRGVADAERRLAELRSKTADPESVAEAERSLERRKYDVEQANFAVAEAEQELAAVRLDPNASAQAIREAEIRLAESKLDVVDSVLAVREAERRLDQQRNVAASPEEIAAAERDLSRAKMAVSDAADAQTEATADLAAAEFIYTEIVEGAKEGSDRYREALKKLTDAKDDEVEASDAVRDALEKERDATDALRESKLKLLEVGNEVGSAAVRRATNSFNAATGVVTDSFAAGFEPIATTVPDFFGGQTIITNNITAGMGADANELAQVIVDNLRQYERANGYVPITTRYAVAV